MRRTLRERYGARTRFRTMGRRPGLARRLGLVGLGAGADWRVAGDGLFEGWADGLVAAVEERALWARFGL